MSLGNEREFIDHLQDKEKGGRTMKCPLTLKGHQYTFAEGQVIGIDCLKEECAWWDEAEAQCAIYSLATWQPHLVKILRAIKDKMPHEEQFRK